MKDTEPKSVNKSRDTLMLMIQSLVLPPNYKVTLSVDRYTENLNLKVLKRTPLEFRFSGKVFWRKFPQWDDSECLQRTIVARTYEALLTQLEDRPEFLEFEIAVEGSVVFQTALDIA